MYIFMYTKTGKNVFLISSRCYYSRIFLFCFSSLFIPRHQFFFPFSLNIEFFFIYLEKSIMFRYVQSSGWMDASQYAAITFLWLIFPGKVYFIESTAQGMKHTGSQNKPPSSIIKKVHFSIRLLAMRLFICLGQRLYHFLLPPFHS